jgi:uncharacterized membrane protein
VPTERRLRVAIGALAVVGLAISAYLTSVRLMGESPACVIGGSCAAVQASRYAELAGIPVAVLGLAGYGALLVSAVLAGPAGKLLGLLAGLIGVGFSVWLTYVEFDVIDAICPWCVTSAVIVTIAAALAVWRVLLQDRQVVGVAARGRSR